MGDTKKILIVDPDQVHAGALKTALETGGHHAELAFTSDQAFTSFEFFQPDLVILEVMLESHDAGFQLLRRIRRHPLLGRTPVFIVTGLTEKTGTRFSLEEDGYWMKADDYAEKPLPLETLLSRAEALLAGR